MRGATDSGWLAGWLEGQGTACIVIDPSAILVDRKAKHRENDAIDARALLDLLVRHVTGDRELHPVAVPPPEAEDARGLGRLLTALGRARRATAARVELLHRSRGIATSYRTDLPNEFDTMRTKINPCCRDWRDRPQGAHLAPSPPRLMRSPSLPAAQLAGRTPCAPHAAHPASRAQRIPRKDRSTPRTGLPTSVG